jgi:hypothetical protein
MTTSVELWADFLANTFDGTGHAATRDEYRAWARHHCWADDLDPEEVAADWQNRIPIDWRKI